MTAEEQSRVDAVIEQDQDSVRISPEVIAIIAGLAAGEVEGIAGMSGGIVDGIAERLGRKDLTKGIRIHLDGETVRIDINVIVDLGVKIVEVAGKLKHEVRSTVENITGLKVASININVQGLNLTKEQEVKASNEED
ncbi:MAG TPA: Asp23/Gls24 family envelope stress response protein [Bacillota bacterium]|nr:Asp23/Gls24 family envelope stress response protein [Bacillota bacterium]